MNPLHCLSLFLLGASLLWAVPIAYGARRVPSNDWLKHCLTVAGWVLLLTGTTMFLGLFAMGPFAIMLIALVLVSASTVILYRQYERQSLLWSMAFAAERQIPLNHAVRAFAQERNDEIGYRAWQLAFALDAGMPLDVALRASRNPVPLNVLVAARIGAASGSLPTALRSAVFAARDADSILRTFFERLLFTLTMFNVMVTIVTFMMVKILPTFERMFREFELELPESTLFLMSIARTFVGHWFWFAPFWFLFLGAMFFSLLHYVGWLPWGFPGVGWMRVSYDRTVLLRALALGMRKQQPIDVTLAMAYDAFPTYIMRARIGRAQQAIRNGQSWTAALRNQRLITRYEQSVLEAAQRVGNLPWALETMADSAVRRLTTRLRRVMNVVTAVMYISFSSLLLLVAVGIFSPLVTLIWNLS